MRLDTSSLGEVVLTVSVKCLTCGALHTMGHCSPQEFPYCDSNCEKLFLRVVERMIEGVPEELVGARPGSRLWLEAEREIGRRRVRAFSEDRQYAEDSYLRNRPRRSDPVWKRYFR
jgi:hypothetical protein